MKTILFWKSMEKLLASTYDSDPMISNNKKQRGIFLNTMLTICGLSVVINLIGLFYPLGLRDMYLHLHTSLFSLWSLTTVIGCLGIAGALTWGKSGVYIIILLQLLILVANLTFLSSVVPLPADIIGLILTFLLIWSIGRKWSYFR
jgi:hypothetical protein